MRLLKFAFLGVLGLTGCDSTTDPDKGVAEDDMSFLRFESASAVTVRQASFWAVKGQGRKLVMRYASTQPGVEGEKFLDFEVGANSLLRKPGGGLFLTGDSVLITATLDNSDRIIVHFEPSGLVFNPIAPAELLLSYSRANRDLDGDGDRDQQDLTLEAALRVWKQERPGLPWLPQVTFRIDAVQLQTNVLSFTCFAMASN